MEENLNDLIKAINNALDRMFQEFNIIEGYENVSVKRTLA